MLFMADYDKGLGRALFHKAYKFAYLHFIADNCFIKILFPNSTIGGACNK